jgi:hypothetical protein
MRMTRLSRQNHRSITRAAVYAENLVRLNLMTESPNVDRYGRIPPVPAEPAWLALPVKEPACGRECRAPAGGDCSAAQVRGRVQLTDRDRLFFIQLYRWFPSVLNAITSRRLFVVFILGPAPGRLILLVCFSNIVPITVSGEQVRAGKHVANSETIPNRLPVPISAFA